jgi:hypothetical protein
MAWRQDLERELGRELAEWEFERVDEEGYLVDLHSGLRTPEQVADEIRGWGTGARSRSVKRSRDPLPTSTDNYQRRRAEILGKWYGRLAEQGVEVPRIRQMLDGTLPKFTRRRPYGPPPGRPALPDFETWTVGEHCRALGVKPGDDEGELAALRARGEPIDFALGPGRDLTVPRSSYLGEVAVVVETLVDTYRWQRWQATRWLVCGGPPPSPMLFGWLPMLRGIAGSDSPTRVRLEVDPALSPREVYDIYARVRSAMFPAERLRPLDDKALALAEFVASAPDDESTWREQWNKGPGRVHGKYPNGGAGPATFRRDVRSAWKRLRNIGWRSPDRLSATQKEEER